MPQTPTIPALPGCSPLGLRMESSFDQCKHLHKTTYEINPGQFATMRGGTIFTPEGGGRGTKINVWFKRPSDDCVHFGTVDCAAFCIPLKKEEIISDIAVLFDAAKKKHYEGQAAREEKLTSNMAKFGLGSKVFFVHPKKGTVIATVIKKNTKSIQIVEEDGVTRWNVTPGLLKTVAE